MVSIRIQYFLLRSSYIPGVYADKTFDTESSVTNEYSRSAIQKSIHDVLRKKIKTTLEKKSKEILAQCR